MFRFPFALIILVFALVSDRLLALEITDLYQANVLVDSQERTIREKSIKLALSDVLLKIGGKESVLTHDVLIKAQKQASKYVSQYRYKRVEEQLSLVVTFNEDKVNRLFEQANLALWGSLRPQVLLWLVDEDGATRSIVSHDADSIIPSTINEFSDKRGLPIIMPLMDLTDNQHVFVSDFWAYFPEQIQQASQRYFADTVIVMRISNSSLLPEVDGARLDTYSSGSNEQSNTVKRPSGETCVDNCESQENHSPMVLDWRVYTQGALYIQKYQGVDKVSLITEALSDITELIYQSYALLTTVDNDFVIEVKNVTSLTNDAKLYEFLNELSAVKNVVLTRVKGDVRQFTLDLNGSKSSFLASLKLNNKLTQILEPQLGDFSQSEEFTGQGENRPTLVAGLHNGVKVIILGEDTPEPAVDDATGSPLVDPKNDTTIVEEDNVLDPTLQDNTDNAVDVEKAVLPLEQAIIKPPVVIPVFYWNAQ